VSIVVPRPWLAHALASVAEGFCPDHGVQLTSPARYCFACGARYWIEDGGTVVKTFGTVRWP
jgi:hypothetical protein